MTKHILILLLSGYSLVCCKDAKKSSTVINEYKTNIECTDKGCNGVYTGSEFIKGSDVAHQFSNEMSKVVGNKMKELYKYKKYVKVDFSKIKMSTKGMGTGKVVYRLYIPFERVSVKCQAYTSFDHVGGWNHTPALDERKSQLGNVLLNGEKLNISVLKTTPEGLQEYWIQWKNKDVQADCDMNKR